MLIALSFSSCCTTSALVRDYKKERPEKFRPSKNKTLEENAKENAIYTWKLENYVDLLESVL